MEDFFNNNFMPHGHCYYWKPWIVWSHAISDSIIAIAYSVIPLSLVHIVRKRRDFKYIWMGVLFAVFILGCGTTHIFDVINIWSPWYVTDSIVRIVTAVASIGTAIVLIRITPEILLIPSTEKWKQVNDELLKSNRELTHTERVMKELNADLEERVQKRTEEAIKKSREFEFLAHAIPQLVWTTDAEGNVQYVNQRWLDYTGQTEAEAMETGWTKAIFPDQLKTTLAYWEKCLQSGEEYNIEFCIRRYDGQYRWFLTRGTPMYDKDGNITQWFGTCTDIHDQKSQTREMEAININLKRINNDLDNFIYTASHDLKAPISNMEGLLNTIYQETKDDCTSEVLDLFDMLSTSVQRLKSTIDDLTDISRIQQSAHENSESIFIPEILEEYQDSHKDQIARCKAVITTDFQEETVNFPKKNFRSVFYNLLSNSLKYYHPERPPRIHVSTKKEDEFIVLSVSDNGIGFEKNQIDKVFGMFKRLHTHVEGSGVGLYIVKKIMENSNGRIEAESEVGKGSEFKLYFPYNENDSVE